MVKDRLFRRLLTPVLALALPYAAGLVRFGGLHPVSALFTVAFFALLLHLLWQWTIKLQLLLRNHPRVRRGVGAKLAAIVIVTALACFFIALAGSFAWQWLVLRELAWTPAIRMAALLALLAALLSLAYEAVLLSAELDVDSKVMEQLEQERLVAETSILQNELDPHFLFNSLNALSYLTRAEPEKAYQFVHRLSNVFKYLLLHKQKDCVSLEEELRHLDDYCFLLQVRFDDSVQVVKQLHPGGAEVTLMPCTLQGLVENAIKHNFFSEKEPLVITIAMDQDYITVTNPVRPKPYNPSSTRTGLQNLRTRYRVLLQQRIVVQRCGDSFQVKVPYRRSGAGVAGTTD